MRDQNALRRLLLGILLVVLVYEWMVPLSMLSNWTAVYSITPLFITIIGVVAVDVLSIQRYWTWIVKLLIILSSVAAMFHGTNLLHLEWWLDFAILIWDDFLHIIIGEWGAVSGEGRTLLFIGAWSTVVCWLYAVILYQRIALYVTMLTVVYLLILQTWLGMDTTKGVVIAVITGLLLHGLSVLPGIESTYGLRVKHSGWPLRWMVSSIVLVSITVGSGLLLSVGQEKTTMKLPASLMKWNWQTLETFSFLRYPAYTTKQTKPVQRSGYSLTDSTLGGSVSSDDSIAFLANTENPDAYWRGESKAVYDGKGWSNPERDLYGYEMGELLPDVLSDDNPTMPNDTTFIQEVFPFRGYPSSEHTTILLSNGAIQRIDRLNVENDTVGKAPGPITIDRVGGKYTLQGRGSRYLTSYSMVTLAPLTSDSAKLMLAANVEKRSVPPAITVPNIQLPEQLPERVSQLAHSITEEFNSTWEKAHAVEQYLHDHYRYTLTPRPQTEDGDFVDQFLFEQQEGYCDYFSTAMTVMLRSIGVPARWVKGFAPGEIIKAEENVYLQESAQRLRASHVKTYSVMIRNRNAHSWVEVYISGIGWTLFDPTPASLAATALVSDTDLTNSADEVTSYQVGRFISSTLDTLQDKRLLHALLWIAAIVVLGQSGKYIYRSVLIRYWFGILRIRLISLLYAWGLNTNHTDTRLLERMLKLILSRNGLVIHTDETVRESVLRGNYPNGVLMELLELVSIYELARYGPPERRRIPYERIIASWRMLI